MLGYLPLATPLTNAPRLSGQAVLRSLWGCGAVLASLLLGGCGIQQIEGECRIVTQTEMVCQPGGNATRVIITPP